MTELHWTSAEIISVDEWLYFRLSCWGWGWMNGESQLNMAAYQTSVDQLRSLEGWTKRHNVYMYQQLTVCHHITLKFYTLFKLWCDWLNRVVGIATCYRWNGPWIKSWWVHDFLHLSGLALCHLCDGYQVSFSGVEQLGCGIDNPPPSSAKVKRKSGAILLLLLWTFVACSGLNL